MEANDGEESPPGPSSTMPVEIEVVDSQDQVLEEGSKKQMVKQQRNASLRELSPDEEETIAENEELEIMGAEQLRKEEERLQENFTSVEMREWEDWAKKDGRLEHGVKRARVQVMVQGEGGRIVKKENWLVGLKDGEYLAYSISVHRHGEEDTEDYDPTAACSGDTCASEGQGEEDEEVEIAASAAEASDALLPVTGEAAPEMWSQQDLSNVKDFSVDDFMETALAERFFHMWKMGEVSDGLIGRRFGYGVLGRFYGRKDWESGVFREESSAEPGDGSSRQPVGQWEWTARRQA